MTIDYEGESYQITKVEFSERYKAYEVYYESPKIDDYFYIWAQDNQIEKFLRGEKAGSFRLLLNTTNLTQPNPTQPQQPSVTQPYAFKVGDKVKIPTKKSFTSFGKADDPIKELSNSVAFKQAIKNGVDYLTITELRNDTVRVDGNYVTAYVLDDKDFFAYDDLELYEEPIVTQPQQPNQPQQNQPTSQPIPKRKKKPFNKDLDYEALFDGYLVDKTKSMVSINQAQTVEKEMLDYDNIIESLGL
jgi:hypothetical protein